MTEEQIEDIKTYFKDRALPATLSMPGSTITNVKNFVSTQLHRIENGVPVIANVSFNHLVRLMAALQSEGQSSREL